MSVRPFAWEDFPTKARALNYRHDRKLVSEVNDLRRAASGCTLAPGLLDVDGRCLLMVQGEILRPEDSPSVILSITFTKEFPNAYPIITLLPPPGGWTIVTPHPHVDNQGQCYLAAVSNWNPQRSTLQNVYMECLQNFSGNGYPFVPVGGGRPQPNHAPPAQRVVQAQPARQQPPPQQRQPHPNSGEAGLNEAIKIGVGVGSLGISALRLAAGAGTNQNQNRAQHQQAPHQIEEQRRRDKAWLDQQRAVANRESDQQSQLAALEFQSLMKGTTRPPHTEIVCPPGFGINRVCVRSAPEALFLVGPAPAPLAPCTDPTPEEQHQLYVRKTEAEKQAEAAKQATAPPTTGFMNKAFKVMSKGASLAGGAKAALEEKARENAHSKDEERFKKNFPEHATEKFVCDYRGKVLNGTGQSVEIHFQLTTQNMFLAATSDPLKPYKPFVVPLSFIASIQRGVWNEDSWIHVVLNNNDVFCLHGFNTTAKTIGTYISTDLTGTVSDRVFNWLDHKWRAACQIPNPGYMRIMTIQQASQGPSQPYPAQPGQGMPPPPPAPAPAPANPNPAPAQQGAMLAQQQPNDNFLCVVCMDAPRNAFFQPCGHLSVCMQCATKMQECPMCRSAITQTLQAFV